MKYYHFYTSNQSKNKEVLIKKFLYCNIYKSFSLFDYY